MASTKTKRKNGASTSVGASMLRKLREGKNLRRSATWPGSEERFWICVLTCDEIQDAQAAAAARWEELELAVTAYTVDDFFSEISTQLLARAMRTEDDPEVPLFASADELRALITPDERTLLTTEYIENQTEANPDETTVGADVMEQIREAIKKKDVIRLSAFGSVPLAIYLLSTDDQPSS